jgi:rhodanese-related sulfurtransferase
MKHLTIYTLFILLGLACTSTDSQAQTKLNADAFQQKMSEKGVQLIDVRTPEEFGSGHLAGAVNYNFNAADFAANMGKLDKNKPVMVYCAAGGRSGRAAQQLQQMGFKQIYDLQGGMGAWKAAGKLTQ